MDGKFHFGRIEIDGATYERDVVIDRGKIRKRNKKLSKKFRHQFGHTPVSVEEEMPWKCQRLIVGTGRYGLMERGEARGAPSKSRSADFAHGRSYRDTGQPTQGNKRHSPRDVLTRRAPFVPSSCTSSRFPVFTRCIV